MGVDLDFATQRPPSVETQRPLTLPRDASSGTRASDWLPRRDRATQLGLNSPSLKISADANCLRIGRLGEAWEGRVRTEGAAPCLQGFSMTRWSDGVRHVAMLGTLESVDMHTCAC